MRRIGPPSSDRRSRSAYILLFAQDRGGCHRGRHLDPAMAHRSVRPTARSSIHVRNASCALPRSRGTRPRKFTRTAPRTLGHTMRAPRHEILSLSPFMPHTPLAHVPQNSGERPLLMSPTDAAARFTRHMPSSSRRCSSSSRRCALRLRESHRHPPTHSRLPPLTSPLAYA